MIINVVSFTKRGVALSLKIQYLLNEEGMDTKVYAIDKYAKSLEVHSVGNLSDWCKDKFEQSEAMIFIGACGIAVRTIAPFIKHKAKDPAVIVVDEIGKYIIPILSGHLGGANALALTLSNLISGEAIITTATDIHHKFAVDVWAKDNNLYIKDINITKLISVAVLENTKVGLYSEIPIIGDIPSALLVKETGELGISISANENIYPYDITLQLIPKIFSLGIGCRKGKTLDEIEEIVINLLKEVGISIHSIVNIASITLKQNEEGLVGFCNKYNIPFVVYSAKQLNDVKGSFTDSEFVKGIVGVDNVCERAAVLGSDEGKLIIKKYAKEGITVAIAEKAWCVNFE